MACPSCRSTNYKKNGRTKLGYQRYICKDCGKSWSNNPQGKGRPAFSDKPMTDAERAKKYRERKKHSSIAEVRLEVEM